jgi:hypothetical protein
MFMVQKLPEISIEAICKPGRECSRVKSSAKVNLLAHGLCGFISEGLALWACPTCLNEGRLLLQLAGRRLFASHFLRSLIAAPIVRLLT